MIILRLLFLKHEINIICTGQLLWGKITTIVILLLSSSFTITVFKIYLSDSQVFQIFFIIFYVSVTIGCVSVKTLRILIFTLQVTFKKLITYMYMYSTVCLNLWYFPDIKYGKGRVHTLLKTFEHVVSSFHF